MDSIGIRELRQNASRYLRQVERGETFEVTDRGRPVARLVPIKSQSTRERLIAEGRLTPAKGKLSDLPPPLEPKPGERPLSEILEEMRADERY